MKKTKLLTSMAALALVLSLGACTEPVEDDVSSEDNEPASSETTTTEDNTSENTSEDNTSEDSSEDNTSGGEGGENQYEDNTITEMLNAIEQDCNYNATTYYLLYQSNEVEYSQEAMQNAEVGIVQGFATDIYATEDAIEIDYLQYLTADNSYGYPEGWYYMDFEIYANDYTTNEMVPYYYYYGYMIEGSRESGTWQDYIWSLADLVDYRWAFTLSSSYLGYEQYNVDEAALDMLINATVGNNYIWDDLFTSGGGWGDRYFGYPDYVSASDIYYGTQADAYGLFTGYPIVEFIFDNAGWYYGSDDSHVLYQEIEAYTDVFLDTLGEIDIASMWEEE